MNDHRRPIILVGAMLLLLAITAAWAGRWQADQKRQAERAASDLAEATRIAAQLEQLRAEPTVVASKDLEIKELGQIIESAAKKVLLADGAISNVYPRGPRPVGDTPYIERATDIKVQQVTLAQLSGFLYYLSHDAGLNVRDLRLNVPRRQARPDQWDADVTLTYMLYAPQEQPGADR